MLSHSLGTSFDHRLSIAFDDNVGVGVCHPAGVIHHTVVRLVIGSDSFSASLPTFSILMKMCSHSAHAGAECSSTVIFSAATTGTICSDASWLVNASAAVLMLVAMLASFTGSGEPFKTELICCDLHNVNWRLVLEDMVLILDRITLVAFYVLLQLNQRQYELGALGCLDQAL
jgi:hypothetical protein